MVKEKYVPALREKMLPQGSKAKGIACLNRSRRGSWPNTPARKTVSMPQSSRPSENSGARACTYSSLPSPNL